MDKLEKDLTGKLKLLKFTFDKTSDIVSKANIVAIERQREALVKITASIDEIKLQILEKKFERGDNEETITDWSKSIENEVEEVDGEVEKLQRYLDTRNAEEASKTKETERVQQLCSLRKNNTNKSYVLNKNRTKLRKIKLQRSQTRIKCERNSLN